MALMTVSRFMFLMVVNNCFATSSELFERIDSELSN